MKICPVYQTIEDRNNPDDVEKDGPVLGLYKPWLGVGYYFWDGFVDNAHWWGKVHVKGDYMICKASVEGDDNFLLDLHSNPEHMTLFSKTMQLLESKLKKNLTVNEAIAYLRKRSDSFIYKVIRAETPNCGSPKMQYPFVNSHHSKLNLIKSIQVCVSDKSFIVDFNVIYPEHYSQDWLG